MSKFIQILLLLAFAQNAFATEICGQDIADGLKYRWCVDHNPESPDVLYIMHGGGGNEHSWRESKLHEEFEQAWREKGVAAPSIITMSFNEGQWLLNDLAPRDQASASGKVSVLIKPVVEIIMPALEAKVGGVRGKRMMMGWSMGGYNAPVLSLRHPGLFDSVALLCPGLGLVDPFLPPDQLERAIQALPAGTNAETVRRVAAWIRHEFETKENWARHEPLSLARGLQKTKTKYFLTCTRDDEYGFFPGAEEFTRVMAGKTSVEWHPLETGGHCAQDLATTSALHNFFSR